MQHYKTIAPYIRGIAIGALLIIALNTADKVVTVNVWPSVLTAHGVME